MNKRYEDDELKDTLLKGTDFLCKGIGGVFNILAEMLEKGEDQYSKQGTFQIGHKEKKLLGSYGLSIKTGQSQLEGLSSLRQDHLPEARPKTCDFLVDIFEEKDHLKIIADLPGVKEDTIKVQMENSKLTIEAWGREVRYFKELALAGGPFAQDHQVAVRNGIVEILLRRINLA